MKKPVVVIKLNDIITNTQIYNVELQLLNTLKISCKKNNIDNKCLKNKDIVLDFNDLIIRPYFNDFLNKYKSKYKFYLLYDNNDIYNELYEQLKNYIDIYFKYKFTYITDIEKEAKSNEIIFICNEIIDNDLKNKKIKKINKITLDIDYEIFYNIIEKNNITDDDLKDKQVLDFINKNKKYFYTYLIKDSQLGFLKSAYYLRDKELYSTYLKSDVTFKKIILK